MSISVLFLKNHLDLQRAFFGHGHRFRKLYTEYEYGSISTYKASQRLILAPTFSAWRDLSIERNRAGFQLLFQEFAISLGLIRGSTGMTLGWLWDQFAITMRSLWDHVGIVLTSFWDHLGSALGSFGGLLGVIFWIFWKSVLEPKLQLYRPSGGRNQSWSWIFSHRSLF